MIIRARDRGKKCLECLLEGSFLYRGDLYFFLLLGFASVACAPVALRSISAPSIPPAASTFSYFSSTSKNGDVPLTSRSSQYFLLAQFYSQQQEGEKAILEYKKAIKADPTSLFLHLRLAQELLQQGEVAKVREVCERAVLIHPSSLEANLMLAGVYMVYKEHSRALAIYERLSRENPKSREVLLHYGSVLMERGKPKEAKKIFEKILSLKDFNKEEKIKSSTVLYHLARADLKMGNMEGASLFLEKAIKEKPSFLRASLLLSQLYLIQGKKEKFLKTLEASYEERSNSMVANRLFSYYVGESQWEKSIPYAETMVGEDPENLDMRLRLAHIYQKANWLGKAKEIFHGIHKESPEDQEVLYYLGNLYVQEEDYTKALDFFLKVKPSYEHYEEVVLRAADSYRAMGSLDKARSLIEKAMKKNTVFNYLHIALARIYEEEKNIAKAVAVLERHRARVYSNEPSLYFLGFLYGELGEVELSLEVMEEILKRNPKNADALNYIGYTLLEIEDDYEEAGRRLKLAMELKPEDAYIMDSYAWFLFKKGEVKGALKLLLKAIVLKPQEGVIMEHLADVYLQLGKEDRALESYRKSLSHLPKTTDQFRVRTKILGLEKSLYQQERLPASQLSP